MEFDADTIASFLTNIYKSKFDIDHDVEETMYRRTREILTEAMATGVADAIDSGTVKMPELTFMHQLGHNIDVFSAFRVHHMQQDVARQMIDSEGKLKPFSQFKKDVQPYISHRNKAWLRTEYDTAIRRAHQATDWQQFEADKDVLPNLEWVASTSPNPGADHMVFWGTILPVDDNFWNEHRPGDRWNCKCELRQTDASATIPKVGDSKDDPQNGLENNPGKDGNLFSQNHPYYPEGCLSCPFAGNRLKALYHDLAAKQDCHKCQNVNRVIDSHVETRRARNRKEYERLKNDPDYIDVSYDKASGGVKAIHKEHNFDTAIGRFGIPRGDYERNAVEALFRSGHSVVLRSEAGEPGVKQPDGFIDGRLMDIKGVEGNALYAINRANIQEVDTVVLYFHDETRFDYDSIKQKWEYFPRWLNENSRITDKTVNLKEVICVVNCENDYKLYEIKSPDE